MNNAEFELRGVGDPRLAVHATSPFPAWLWSVDGKRILWANPVGAKLFGAANGAILAKKLFGPADSHRRQVAQLAGKLPRTEATRLERLRGFGAPLGMLVTCGCARLAFADGSNGILVAAAERTGRAMPLIERLQRLVEDFDSPVAAFARDGSFVGANDAARPLLGFRNLSEAGLEQARSDALKRGRVEAPIGIGYMVLQRVGTGADVGLIALIAPDATPAARVEPVAPAWPQAAPAEPAPPPVAPVAELPMPDCEQPAIIETHQHEPSHDQDEASHQDQASDKDQAWPFVEAVADEPLPPLRQEPAATIGEAAAASIAAAPAEAPAWLDELAPGTRRHPLRFMWQMDAEGRFSLGADEFTRLIGARTATGFGRLWSEIAEVFDLDPDGRVLKAVATGDTWSGVIVNWPVDGGGRLPVELSGLPIHDRRRNFAGYRGFGVCRDLDGLARLAALRRFELFTTPPTPQSSGPDADPPALPSDAWSSHAESQDPIIAETSQPTDLETPVETPKNVLLFRPIGDAKSPVLTPVETSAFDELARQLAARLEGVSGLAAAKPTSSETSSSEASEAAFEPPATPEPQELSEQPGWLAQPEPPARGESGRDKMLLDLLPVGVLIYRLNRLLYANPAFLERIGYQNLHALEQAGGLDALYVEPGVSTASSTSDTGTPVTISASPAATGQTAPPAADARLYTISWDGVSALALIFSASPAQSAALAAAITEVPSEPSPAGHTNAEELAAILDTTADGIVMFDADGNLNSCNSSAEALFGYDGDELVQRNLAELFAPESQRVVGDYLEAVKSAGVASLLDHGRDVLGRASRGGLIPLSMTMGRTRTDSPNFFAVFRDLSQSKKSESELQQARRLADRAANAKADMLARISHELRTPLNAIIGFAEVMIGERFGALNERYAEYMKDIRASGERVIAVVNDLLDLSRIETGKLDLAFASQNLNDVIENCVAVMQPQANRERIIIRTSLAHALPPVVADAKALRQITMNLIGNSIHLANAGGQVIVSTALSDFGDVVLRVRDTGHGLNDNEVAAALEPFRTQAPSDQASDNPGVSLSLTKALVEANRAQFHIKTGAHSGTLIEVVFRHEMAKA